VGEWIAKNPQQAKAAINAQLKLLTGKPLPAGLLDAAFARVLLTYDPLSAELLVSASRAGELGYLPRENVFPLARLREVFDLSLLNDLLKERHLPPLK
jgi:NitT/TauT family transport system substrate-binding protein